MGDLQGGLARLVGRKHRSVEATRTVHVVPAQALVLRTGEQVLASIPVEDPNQPVREGEGRFGFDGRRPVEELDSGDGWVRLVEGVV